MAHEEGTANEELLLALVRHQIGLQRFAGSVREEVFALLDATEADLEMAIARNIRAGGVDPTNVAALRQLLSNIKSIRDPMWKEIGALVRTRMAEMTKAEPSFVAMAMTASSPVVLDLNLPSAELLATLARKQPSDGRTVQQWLTGMARADIDRIMAQVRIGMVQGESIQQMVRRVLGSATLNGRDALATELTRRNVESVVRTMTNGLSNAAKGAFYEANKGVISAEVWVSTLDGRTCKVCMGLDGRKFPVGVGRRPPAHVGCRCVRVAVLDGGVLGNRPMKPVTEKALLREFQGVTRREDLAFGTKGAFDTFARRRVRELTGTVPARTTYTEFLKRQSVEFQDEVLGITKARLFRKGGLDIRRFTDRRGNELTLSELASREKAAFRAAGLDPGDFI